MTGPASGRRAAIYVRVSKGQGAQSLVPQFQAVRALCESRGWRVVAVYRDRASGVKDRPGLRRALHDGSMNRYDVIAVWALDRFGRTTLEVLSRVQALHDRGVAFVSVREAAIDTSTAAGALILTVMAAVAAFERQRLIERTTEAVRSRRARGVKLGRPAALSPAQVEGAAGAVGRGTPLARAARDVGVSPRTLRRCLRTRYGTTDRDALSRVLAAGGAA